MIKSVLIVDVLSMLANPSHAYGEDPPAPSFHMATTAISAIESGLAGYSATAAAKTLYAIEIWRTYPILAVYINRARSAIRNDDQTWINAAKAAAELQRKASVVLGETADRLLGVRAKAITDSSTFCRRVFFEHTGIEFSETIDWPPESPWPECELLWSNCVLSKGRFQVTTDRITADAIGAAEEHVRMLENRLEIAQSSSRFVEAPYSSVRRPAKLEIADGGFVFGGVLHILAGRPQAVLKALLAAPHQSISASNLETELEINVEVVENPRQVVKDAIYDARKALKGVFESGGLVCENPIPRIGFGKDLTYTLRIPEEI